MDKLIISDIIETVQVINTYNLECLVWSFSNCPLNELNHYIPKGKEELVVVCHKENNYLSSRLTFDSGVSRDRLDSDFNVTLDFHNEYAIHIIMNFEDEN